MEQITITINNMADVRREIDNCQRKAMTSVVELGYILRKADDAGLYKEQGYASIFKFAEAEYGWSQSQTSRFMNINREFSEGGYSAALKERYKEFGQAKLAEMLTLPEIIREELDPAMKRSDIREIKSQFRETGEEGKENAFEAAVYDRQEEGEAQAAVENLFAQPEMAEKLKNLYPYMQKVAEGGTVEDEDIRMAISSTGFGTARAGAVMFFWKKENICMIRGDQKTGCPYRGFLALLNKLQDPRGITVREWYRNVYGKDLPEEEPEKQEIQPEKKETSSHRQEKEKMTAGEKPASGIETSTNGGGSGEEREPELEGQTELHQYAEKMPVEAETGHYREEPPESEHTDNDKDAAKPEVPKQVSGIETSTNSADHGTGKEEDGSCPYCSGRRSIQSNNAAFWLTVHKNGLARIGNDTEVAVMEFNYCPMCGEEMDYES